MEKLMIKVICQGDGIPEDMQLVISLTDKGKDKEGKRVIDLNMGPGNALLTLEPSVYTNIYHDIVQMLDVVARSITEDGAYESVYTLKQSEYKKYVEQVLGYNFYK